MAMNDLDILADEDLAKQWKRREDCRESGRPVDNPMWQVVDLDTIGEVSYPAPFGMVVCVRYYYYSMASVD